MHNMPHLHLYLNKFDSFVFILISAIHQSLNYFIVYDNISTSTFSYKLNKLSNKFLFLSTSFYLMLIDNIVYIS